MSFCDRLELTERAQTHSFFSRKLSGTALAWGTVVTHDRDAVACRIGRQSTHHESTVKSSHIKIHALTVHTPSMVVLRSVLAAKFRVHLRQPLQS